jgi:hypothetical protein
VIDTAIVAVAMAMIFLVGFEIGRVLGARQMAAHARNAAIQFVTDRLKAFRAEADRLNAEAERNEQGTTESNGPRPDT